jgi:membrane protease YdiL (CAAX protease family)
LNQNATLTPTQIVPPTQPSALRRTFMGPQGLRAGWSLLIFVAIFAAFAFCINVVGHKLHLPSAKPGSELSPSFGYVAESLNFGLTVLVTWIMSKIERRPIAVYGFGDNRKLPHFLAGLGWGVTCLSLLVLTLWKAGLLVIDTRLLYGSEVFRYGAIWLGGFLLVALAEEYLVRGYLQFTLTRGLAGLYRSLFKTQHSEGLGFWTAAVIFSTLFGLGHSNNQGESPIGLLAAGMAGLVLCFSLWRTGSLWWAVGFHTSWDWAQSFLYGVPDSGLVIQHRLLSTHPAGKLILSGGTTGPEGSIFVVPILALVALIILFSLRRTRKAAMPELSGSPTSVYSG